MQNESVDVNQDTMMNTFQASKGNKRRDKDLRRARALRQLEMLHEKHELEVWMTEVWDEPGQLLQTARKISDGDQIYSH